MKLTVHPGEDIQQAAEREFPARVHSYFHNIDVPKADRVQFCKNNGVPINLLVSTGHAFISAKIDASVFDAAEDPARATDLEIYL